MRARARATSARWLHLVLLLLLCIAVPVPAPAQQNPAREIAESQRRLEQIRRERQQLRTEMDRIRTRVRDISSELRNLEQQVATSASALREIEFQLTGTEQEMQLTTEDLGITRRRIAERKGVLHRRLRDIYKRGSLHTPQVLLTARSFSDLLNRYKYLYLLAQQDRALVQEISELERKLVLRDRQLRQSLLHLQSLQREKAQEYAQMESLEAERKRTLSTMQARQQTTSRRIQQLEQDERRLQNLLATLERRRREAERAAAERAAAERRAAANAPAAGAASPPAARREGLSTRDLGNLGWPVEGTLTYRFGRAVQPNGTAIRYNGIGIAAPSGTPVRSVDAGRVVLASPFEGYGPTVVLSHGGGYYSLYLYLRDISVREGAEVTRGQTVGTVGGSSGAETSHIEFQIRAPGGQAVDPLSWLRQRGR